MQEIKAQIDLLFETSWEVCNKVGGIYTVLTTKAKQLHDVFGDKLVFIGPDIRTADNEMPDFIERKTLLKNAEKKLSLPYDISIRVGRWNIPGSPLVVLVKFTGVYGVLNTIFGDMWNSYGVDSLHAYGDYSESCAFAVASAIVIEAISVHLGVNPLNIEAHFNEWTTGMGLLYLKSHVPEIATLFTTHATGIGRSICSNGKPLYDYFGNYNGDQMARELNMESKHSLEKAAAYNADCFTTVSEVTARECGQLLGVEPHVVTTNGFEPSIVPGAKKMSDLRKKGRERLLKIVSSLKDEQWKDEDTFIVATSGRHEFRNKGIDLYLDAVSRIHAQKKCILALVLVPGWIKEPSGDLVKNLAENAYIRPCPDFLTHRLNNEDSDLIVRKLYDISGQEYDSSVAAVYVPCYLDGHDGIVDISYYSLLPALDLTVFPSYYEPWGYTPLESIAFGIPTLTSDKAGFGQWVLSSFQPEERKGVKVIKRTDSNYDVCVEEIAGYILKESEKTATEIAGQKKNIIGIADKADWQHFIKEYFKAFDIAAKHRDARLLNIEK